MILNFDKSQINNINTLVKSIKNLNIEESILKLTTKGVGEAEIEAALRTKGYTNEKIKEAMANATASKAEETHTIKTRALSVAQKIGIITTKALNAALTMGVSVIGSLLLSGVTEWIISLYNKTDNLKETVGETIEKIKELNNEFKEKKDYVKEYGSKYAELAQKVDQLTGKNLTLSDDEYKEFLDISNKLSEIFPSLIYGFDDSNNAIINLNGSINEITNSIDLLIKKEEDLYNQQISDEIPNVFTDYIDEISKASDEMSKYTSVYKALSDISNYKINSSNGTSRIEFYKKNYNGFDPENILKELSYLYSDTSSYINYDYDLDKDDNTLGYNFIITVGNSDVDKFIKNDTIQPLIDKINIDSKNIQNEILKQKNIIAKQYNDLNKILYSYLQTNFTYNSVNENTQKAIQKIVNNIQWDKLNIDNWDNAEKYINDNILSLFNNYTLTNNLKDELVTLLTIDSDSISNDEYINLYNKITYQIKTYFKENDIDIPLNINFIVDKNKDLQERVRKSIYNDTRGNLIDYNYLLNYVSTLNYDQLNTWLEVTDNIDDVYEKVKAFENISNKSDDIDFISDYTKEGIDNYKNKLSDLSKYLEKINSINELSNEDMSTLYTTYNIVGDSIDEYKNKIINLMDYTSLNSDVILDLKEEIKSCDNIIKKMELQKLYNYLIGFNSELQSSTTGFDNLKNAISSLQSSAQLLRDIRESINNTDNIDISKLDEIISKYPTLTNAVAKYNAKLISSEELFNQLEQCYKDDVKLYNHIISVKLQYDTKYYDKIKNNISEQAKELLEEYKIDYKNFVNYNQAKLALQLKLYKKQINFQKSIDEVQYLQGAFGNVNENDKKKYNKVYKKSLKAEKKYKDILKIIQSFEDSLSVDFLDTSWSNFGNSLDEEKIEDKYIDWVTNSLNNLNETINDIQNKLDNTNGLDNQLKVINELIGKLELLKNGYSSAANEYNSRFIGEDYNNIVKIIGVEKTNEYYTKIKSGKVFNLENLKVLGFDNDTTNELLNYINQAIEDYHTYEDMYNNIIETDNKIKEKKNQKIQNFKDENQKFIDNIENQLENSSLTSKEKDNLNNVLNKAILKDFKFQIDLGLLSVDDISLQNAINKVKSILSKKQLKKYATDKDIVNAFLPNILNILGDNNLLSIYYDMLNKEHEQILSNYELYKSNKQYRINNNDNKITDIENEISEFGGRGNKEQYVKIKSLERKNKKLWNSLLEYAKKMLSNTKSGTEEWDKWNSEIQECENNIHQCNEKIKECNISILSLPLNDIQDNLNIIQLNIDKINHEMNIQNTIISAANELLDNKINAYEELKKENQDQINALQQENTLRKSNLEVSKAEYELSKLKNQKTQKVFKEGIGWVFEVDEEALKSAQETYDDAIFNNKITILQNQNNEYDKEIDKLNEIKKIWNKITTDAQAYIDIIKASSIITDFENKVLSGNKEITDNISNIYTDLLFNKTNLEEKQYNYQTLQNTINDVIEKYKIEALTFIEAKQHIKDAIEIYCPDISKSYEDIMESIENLKEQEDIESDNVKNKVDSNKLTIEKSNEEIYNSYNNLLNQLNIVFQNMEELLSHFSGKSKEMISSIINDVTNVQRKLSNFQNLPIGIGVQINNKGKATNVGESHTGMELGYVSKNMDSSFSTKDDFKVLCLDKLKPNEILRKLEIGESVLTSNQRDMVMNNFNTMAKTLTHLPLRKIETSKSIAFNGDIIVNGVNGDINAFAKAIKTQLPNALLQELHK